MEYYIITSEPKEQFDDKGKILGMSEKLAVFYSPSIGRKRYYRQSMTKPQKGLKLLSFKKQNSALKVCGLTNEVSDGGWKVECRKVDW